MKIHSLPRSLFLAACTALLATHLPAAESPRERLSMDAGWKFHLGDQWPDALRLDKAGMSSGPASEKLFSDVTWRTVGGLYPATTANIVSKPEPAAWSRSLFNGQAQIIVQASRDAGVFTLSTSSNGLKSATTVVKTQRCEPRPSAP
ncbi:MAG: hypothetical protein ABI162_14640 [Luteolibacter sp.]